jgi:hypothetical protein
MTEIQGGERTRVVGANEALPTAWIPWGRCGGSGRDSYRFRRFWRFERHSANLGNCWPCVIYGVSC